MYRWGAYSIISREYYLDVLVCKDKDYWDYDWWLDDLEGDDV